MQVTSSTATQSTSATTADATAKAATVDYNAFLQLLVKEMQNQDPTNPSDPTQYLGQLASFSNVEQSIQTNNKLDTLLTTSSLTQADAMLGRKVTSADGSQKGTVVSVALNSSGGATATLSDGSTLLLDKTVKVSAA